MATLSVLAEYLVSTLSRMAGDVARLARSSRVAPVTMSGIAVSFAVIAAVWLALDTARAEVVALFAIIGVCALSRVGRVIAGRIAAPAVEWGLVACAVLAELIVYAGMAAGATLGHAGAGHVTAGLGGPAAATLRGTFVAGFGGAGATGVWRLAVVAAMLSVLLPMVEVCLYGPTGSWAGTPLMIFGTPGDVRLPLVGLVVLLAGVRAAFLAVLVLGVAALAAAVIDGTRAGVRPASSRGFRGDGWLSVRIGKFVAGRLPPLPPLLVGLLVTGMLAALGLRNLPGILILTPAEAMLLAALASSHPHDGRSDWLVPPLLQAAEYVILAELGFAGRLWPPVTFALIAVAGLRHLDLAYRARGDLASGTDRRGFGWEGRLIIVSAAAALGGETVVYPAMAVYLWWLFVRDATTGWARA
jgi:hypothetical protein